jgi:hypothetical protein
MFKLHKAGLYVGVSTCWIEYGPSEIARGVVKCG